MTETTALASFLSDLGSILTAELGWTTSVLTTVMNQPVLMLGLCGGMCLIGVGIVRRLTSL